MRAQLRLRDLKVRKRSTARLMNVKVPENIGKEIERVAQALDATKTDVVVALLNHGLDVASKALGGWSPPPDLSVSGRVRRRQKTAQETSS